MRGAVWEARAAMAAARAATAEAEATEAQVAVHLEGLAVANWVAMLAATRVGPGTYGGDIGGGRSGGVDGVRGRRRRRRRGWWQ